jgi:hypothetical protein
MVWLGFEPSRCLATMEHQKTNKIEMLINPKLNIDISLLVYIICIVVEIRCVDQGERQKYLSYA